ncbi:iris-like [Rhipicephalus microplus]|uniref:iris-like n=1 Tax=Rhipicephalus microplus TaxID=6941 RepID=UPI003F6A58F7
MPSSKEELGKPGPTNSSSTSITKVAVTGEGVARVCNALAVNVSKQLLRIKAPSKPDDIPVNIVFSPLSVGSALSMVLAGTSGSTSGQLASALGGADVRTVHEHFRHVFNELGRTDDHITISLANRLYADDRFRPLGRYQTTLNRCYASTVGTESFHEDAEACRSSINACVERTTCLCIKELLPQGSLHPSTQLALVSALYFKARWNTPFDPCRTVPGDFHECRTRVVRTRMMSGDAPARLNRYCDGLVGHALDVAYKGSGGRFSMTLIVPDQVDGLDELVNSLTTEHLDGILRGFDPEQDMQLELPRFKVEDTTDLKAVLRAMGVNDLFDPLVAEFPGFAMRGDTSKESSTGIVPVKALALSVAVHKAFIDVNEEGTETAPPKDVRVTPGSFITDPHRFRVDRPFYFLIRCHNPEAIMFTGCVRHVQPL